MLKLGLKRMAVILHNEYESTWLRTSAQLSDILSMLNPFLANLMNAYPIDNKIVDKTLNYISLVQPTGKAVYQEATGYQRVKRMKQEKGNFSHLTLEERMKPGNIVV
jgi:hypothetical protein